MASADQHWVRVASVDDFGGESKLACRLGQRELLLCRQGGRVFAVSNACPHQGRPLDQARLLGDHLICPFHGARFDLRTGAVVSGPSVAALPTYAVRIDGSEVLVEIDAASRADPNPFKQKQ